MLTRPFVVLNVCFLLSVGGWLPALSLLSVMIRDRLGSSVIAAMLTFLAMQVFAAVLGLYAGGFSARWGSRQTFMVGTAGMAIFTGLILIATYDWQVIVLAALAGMLTPFHWTGINAYMLEAVAPQRRGAAAGMVAFSLVIGPGIFGPLLTLLGDGFGLWATFAGASALLSLSFLTAWLVLPDLKDMVARSHISVRSLMRSYRRLLGDRAVLISVLTRSMSGASFGVFQLLSAFVLLTAIDELAAVGFYLSAGAIGGGASQVLIGSISDRVGRRNLLIATTPFAAAAALIFWRSTELLPLLAGAVMQMFGQSSLQSLLTAISGDLVNPKDVPIVSGLHTSGFAIGMLIGVTIGGLLWGTVSGLPFLVIALAFIPIVALLFWLPQRTLSID